MADVMCPIGNIAKDFPWFFKYLLRQGQEAVQVVHELDIISTEYLDDDSPAVSGDMVRRDPTQHIIYIYIYTYIYLVKT